MDNNKLHNIKESGFKTPNNYFDGLEDSIMNQIKLKEKIEDTGFKVPDNYFDSLDNVLVQQTKKETKVISLFNKRNLWYAASIAAILVLMISIFTPTIHSTSDLEVAEIEQYLLNQDISEYELAGLLNEEELNTTYFVESELSEELLEDYLLQNTTLEDLLIE